MNTAVPVPGASPKASNLVVIAGQTAGRQIYCAPGLAEEVQKLEEADRQGNHWARVAIKELKALTTSHLGKKNVFVEENPHLRRNVVQGHTQNNPHIKHSITLFYAFLPGLKATIAQRQDGGYFVVDMEVDGRYSEATEDERPGLYRANKNIDSWDTVHTKTGQIKPNKDRPVAIADACYEVPKVAAEAVAPYFSKTLGSMADSILEEDGFDLHFTPGEGRLGSLIRYGSQPIQSAHGAAVQLAHTMANASTISRVNWVAEYGGSAILTQAMKILATRGVTLDGHNLYLYHPRTSPRETTQLAHKLKLTLSEDFTKAGFDVRAGISKSLVASERLSAPKDRYNPQAHVKARWTTVGKVVVVSGVGVAAGGFLGGTFPMVAAITSALGKVTGTASAALGAGAVAEHLMQPHAHKFKRLGRKG